jgi:hypothetical protein
MWNPAPDREQPRAWAASAPADLDKAALERRAAEAARFQVQGAPDDRVRCWRCVQAASAKAAADPWEPTGRAEALAATAAQVWKYFDSPGQAPAVGSAIAQAADESPRRLLKADAKA